MRNTVKLQNKKGTKVIAHRGLSGIEQENTNAAFTAAANRSYFGIETDVHVTSDGGYVLIHDDRTGRVAGGDDMCVEASTYQTLRNLLLCDKDGTRTRNDLRIPDLLDYIRICQKYGKIAVLELKNTMDAAHIAGIAQAIRGAEYFENVIFISFSYENLVNLRAVEKSARVQFLCGKADDALLDQMANDRFDLDIYFEAVDRRLVDACHARGIEINCWTVDSPADAERLIDLGVDYITSNILE